ncbi:MAG: NAAT family transporter [Burkholderiales bacterium]|nr:NAAT family transporter [Burkholderiales bacterium]MCZ2104612.1 NAAT family transporter [Burkholderiales bacterium]
MELTLPVLVVALGKSLLFAIAAVLPIINPLATAPIFVAWTQGMNDRERRHLATTIGKYVTLLLALTTVLGSLVLDFFGISLPVVRVAGGIIVAYNAWLMLNTQEPAHDETTQMAQTLTRQNARREAFYPLSFPITCGPGSLAAAIAVGASLHSPRITETLASLTGALMGMVLVGTVVALTYRYATALLRKLGEVGQLVFLRLMAFLLLAVGVQIIWEGVRGLILSLPGH